MKTLWMKTIVLLFLGTGTVLHAQDRENVPGDNFSLEGALELFKKSSSPEEFERLLNLPESEVNNLDLNGDGDTDYIRVIDRHEGNIHTFTLQAVISSTEFQDIAVISLEKLADGKAVLQITGDADIYGIETIIEPTEEVRINAGTTTTRTYVNVWTWPSVQYVYSPYYTTWVSPWYWDYRPIWWRPWRPVAYVVYYPRWNVYRPYYRYCDAPRIRYASRVYVPHRATSLVVYNRHHEQISTYRSTRMVSGETRGRENQRNSSSMRYDNRNRSTSTNNRSSSNDWSGRENSRERSDTNTGRRESNNQNTRTNQWQNRDAGSTENRTRTTERSSTGSRSSTKQSKPVIEQPRSNSNERSGSNNRTEYRQRESSQSRPVISTPSQPRQSSGGQQRSNSGSSGNSSSQKRGRN